MKYPTLLLFTTLLGLSPVTANERTYFTGDHVTAILADNREETRLSGNVTIRRGTKIITADEVILKGEDFEEITCVGEVFINDTEEGFSLKTEQLEFNTETEILRSRTETVMEDRKNNLTIKTNFFEYREKEARVTLQVNIEIDKDDLTATSGFAVYWRDTELLELSGFPKVIKKENTFQAALIRVNLKTDEIVMEGHISGTLKGDEKTEPPPQADTINTTENSEGSEESSGT